MRLSNERKAALHKALIELKEGPRYADEGICDNLHTALSQTELKAMKSLFKKWPKFSGNPAFPVPGHDELSPEGAFNCHKNLWNKRTKYGRLRWELLDFLIEATKPEGK